MATESCVAGMPHANVVENLLSTLSLSADAPPSPPPIAAVPMASLLGIPPELRLHVYDYMSLWPDQPERSDWLGVYYSCRTIQSELPAHTGIKQDIERRLDTLRAIQGNFALEPVYSNGEGSLLHGLTLTLPISYTNQFPEAVLRPIYALLLDHVNIQLDLTAQARAASAFLKPYGDLKSLDHDAFARFITGGGINCKKVTFTIKHLAEAEGGREKSTDLFPIFQGAVEYTMTIVQDKREKQVEKSFISPTRFRPKTNEVPSGGTPRN